MGRATVASEAFGTARGVPVERWTLANGAATVRVLTYGGIVQTIEVPDRDGRPANVTLGFATTEEYAADNPAYFGALVGRYANRLSGGFTLDGRRHETARNFGNASLHGGIEGFSHRVWAAAEASEEDRAGLRLRLVSPDGDQGYPGTMTVEARYSLGPDADLRIDYRATTDAPTVVNLTNHAYFNLGGEGNGTVEDHLLQIFAGHVTEVDADAIPSGNLLPLAGTPLDFRQPHPIGERIRADHPQLLMAHGYDFNYVLDRPAAPGALAECARVVHPGSGRVLTAWTDQPAVQLYTGNYLDGSRLGTSGRAYRQGDGFCLETQHFPDSPNRPEFPSTLLRPGEEFRSTTVYVFSVAG